MSSRAENQVEVYLAQIDAHLGELADATKSLKREARELRKAARRGNSISFDLMQARVYAIGAAARWFLHPMAPLVNPSPSLADNPDTATGRKGEHPSDGVI